MVLELLLLLLVLWLYSGRGSTPTDPAGPVSASPDGASQQQAGIDPLTQHHLQEVVNRVVKATIGYVPSYTIVESAQGTFTRNKSTIHVQVRDSRGYPYSSMTLTRVLLHEMAHILCPQYDIGEHSPVFYNIERRLLSTAARMGYYDGTSDTSYPCRNPNQVAAA